MVTQEEQNIDSVLDQQKERGMQRRENLKVWLGLVPSGVTEQSTSVAAALL